MDLAERFWSHVAKLPGRNACWIWLGDCFETKRYPGHFYGRFYPKKRKMVLAHRFAYALKHRKISRHPIDHKCRVTLCVRHLKQVTHRQNILNGYGRGAQNARKIRCLNGHRFTYVRRKDRSSGRRRTCRKCRADYMRKWQQKNREHYLEYLREWRKQND